MKFDDGEWQFGVEILKLNCLIVYLYGLIQHMYPILLNTRNQSSYNLIFVINYFHIKVPVNQYWVNRL